ncbi:MAG: MFS transporter [Vulcanimicrobiaceae bacterium]
MTDDREATAPERAKRMTIRFRVYLVAAASFDTGFWMYTVASGWLVLGLTASPFWLGTIAACGQFPYLLFSMYGGTLADRFDRRLLIAGGNAMLGVVALALAALVASRHVTIASLAALAFAIGTIVALEHPIDRAWLYDLVRGEAVGRAIALSSLEFSVARTIGPALGGVAVATVGVAGAFVMFAGSIVPIVALALALGRRSIRASDARSAKLREAGETRVSPRVTRDAIVVPVAFITAAFTIGILPYITLLPDIAKNVLHVDVGGFGLLSACGGGGAIVAALALAKIGDLRTKGRIIPLAIVLACGLLVAFSFARSIVVAGALLVALGAIDTLVYALANTYVQECAGDADRGRANGIFSLAFLGGIPVGNLAVGALAGRLGSETALAVTATAAACACVAFWFLAPASREAA